MFGAVSKLADFLNSHPRLKGLSIVEKGRVVGLQRPTMSRIVRGLGKPTVENALRIAAALDVHPGTIHELAGQTELAGFYWKLFPMGAGSHPLQRRLTRLLTLGQEGLLSDALDLVEAACVERLGEAVQKMAAGAGAEAALLLGDTPSDEGMVISAWRCAADEQAILTGRRKAKGWQSCRHNADSLTLTLFLKRTGSPADQAESLLSLIAAFLSSKVPG